MKAQKYAKAWEVETKLDVNSLHSDHVGCPQTHEFSWGLLFLSVLKTSFFLFTFVLFTFSTRPSLLSTPVIIRFQHR